MAAKRYDDPIEVDSDPVDGSLPGAFSWRGRRYVIDQRIGSWREAWAGPESGCEREYFRVAARPAGTFSDGALDPDGFLVPSGAVYDLCRDRIRDTWFLARVWD